jgi:hypothetical protein
VLLRDDLVRWAFGRSSAPPSYLARSFVLRVAALTRHRRGSSCRPGRSDPDVTHG